MIFNREESEDAKNTGMQRAANAHRKHLEIARQIAKELGAAKKAISADDVIKEYIRRGHSTDDLGNAAGSIFKGSSWQMVGYTLSDRVQRHRNVLRRWMLVA